MALTFRLFRGTHARLVYRYVYRQGVHRRVLIGRIGQYREHFGLALRIRLIPGPAAFGEDMVLVHVRDGSILPTLVSRLGVHAISRNSPVP